MIYPTPTDQNNVLTTILCFGDSITHGEGDASGGWPQRLKESLHEIELYNLGINGDRAPELAKRIHAETLARAPEGTDCVIVIAIGVNDSAFFENAPWTSKQDFTRAIRTCLRTAREFTEDVFVVGIAPVDEAKLNPCPWSPRHSYKNMEVREYDTIVRQCASEVDATYIDLQKMFLSLPDYKQLLPDGLHPNQDGHELIAAVIEDCIKEKKEKA